MIIGGLFPMGRINPLTASSYASCVFISILEYLGEKQRAAETFRTLLQRDSKYVDPSKTEMQLLFLKPSSEFLKIF